MFIGHTQLTDTRLM